MAVLTHEQQAFMRPMSRTGMPTHRARLTAVVGIDLDGHALMQERLIGDHAVQFGKGPLGVSRIGLSLLPGNGFRPLAVLLAPSGPSLGTLADMGQVLQTDKAMGVLFDDAGGNDMIGVLRSPVSPVH